MSVAFATLPLGQTPDTKETDAIKNMLQTVVDRVQTSLGDETKVDGMTLLGKGSFGAAYRLEVPNSGIGVDGHPVTSVVTKIQMVQKFQPDFIREVNAMSHLNGFPGIIRMFGFDSLEYTLIIESGISDLAVYYKRNASVSKRRSVLLRQTPVIMYKLCSAVLAMHEMGLQHNDIKPLNMVMTPYGEPKLIDFGLTTMKPYQGVKRSNQAYTIQYRPVDLISKNLKEYETKGTIGYSYIDREPFKADVWALAVSFIDFLDKIENSIRSSDVLRVGRLEMLYPVFIPELPAQFIHRVVEEYGEHFKELYGVMAKQMAVFGENDLSTVLGEDWGPYEIVDAYKTYILETNYKIPKSKGFYGILPFLTDRTIALRTLFPETIEWTLMRDLLKRMLLPAPKSRLNIRQVMEHSFFNAERKTLHDIHPEKIIDIAAKKRGKIQTSAIELNRKFEKHRLHVERDIAFNLLEAHTKIFAPMFGHHEKSVFPIRAMRAYFPALLRKTYFAMKENSGGLPPTESYDTIPVSIVEAVLIITRVLFTGFFYVLDQKDLHMNDALKLPMKRVFEANRGVFRSETVYDYIEKRCPSELNLDHVLSASFLVELCESMTNDYSKIMFSAIRFVNSDRTSLDNASGRSQMVERVLKELGVHPPKSDPDQSAWASRVHKRVETALFSTPEGMDLNEEFDWIVESPDDTKKEVCPKDNLFNEKELNTPSITEAYEPINSDESLGPVESKSASDERLKSGIDLKQMYIDQYTKALQGFLATAEPSEVDSFYEALFEDPSDFTKRYKLFLDAVDPYVE